MGNRISRKRRSTVDDRFTKPQRIASPLPNVDYKKLRKLILSGKLAPCFDAVDDSDPDLEECPICFYNYKSLNRSKCCTTGICTECFLQMKPSNSNRLAQCPFCKKSCYSVEYRGARTQKEKDLEEAEEQKVIEAKIRMQREDTLNTEWVIPADHIPSLVEVRSPMSSFGEMSSGDTHDERVSEESLAWESTTAGSPIPNTANERDGEFDLDVEEIMLMEAIWQSIQDTSLQKSSAQQSCRQSDMCENVTHSHALESELDEAGSESECLASCSSATGDGLLPVGSRSLGPEFTSDSDHITEGTSIRSCCSTSSSLHSFSETSYGSPNCSADSAGSSCSQFSGPITADKQLTVADESNA
eukprot:TRINITY_DN26788_c0_g1_i1.p1 TRINITY_DN26788_c0_g1~~TRINITY_DN26788_c0_g1_i1.p1  ORF type:complete len:398 (-),score=47.48 TRINITY_DN26788_c0_g1_i1:270-1343(-)